MITLFDLTATHLVVTVTRFVVTVSLYAVTVTLLLCWLSIFFTDTLVVTLTLFIVTVTPPGVGGILRVWHLELAFFCPVDALFSVGVGRLPTELFFRHHRVQCA